MLCISNLRHFPGDFFFFCPRKFRLSHGNLHGRRIEHVCNARYYITCLNAHFFSAKRFVRVYEKKNTQNKNDFRVWLNKKKILQPNRTNVIAKRAWDGNKYINIRGLAYRTTGVIGVKLVTTSLRSRRDRAQTSLARTSAARRRSSALPVRPSWSITSFTTRVRIVKVSAVAASAAPRITASIFIIIYFITIFFQLHRLNRSQAIFSNYLQTVHIYTYVKDSLANSGGIRNFNVVGKVDGMRFECRAIV